MTPYEMDLQVKDRRPDITPKVGDYVKIKSREWYEKWKNANGDISLDIIFVTPMSRYCGRTIEVIHHDPLFNSCRLKENKWNWHTEMFEEVYPKETYNRSRFDRFYEEAKNMYPNSAILRIPRGIWREVVAEKQEQPLVTIKKNNFIKLRKV